MRDALLTPKGLEVIMWVSTILFIDSFAASFLYKRYRLFGLWRFRNAILGFYLISVLLLCTVFIFNYIFEV